MNINSIVITVMDTLVAVVLCIAAVIGGYMALFAFMQGNFMAALWGMAPVVGTMLSCSVWCVLSGIYHNTCKEG